MGESNGSWSQIPDEMKAVWDRFKQLPDPGENDILDAFVESKNIDIPALVRQGTRLTEEGALAFGLEGGIKFREMESGRRWNFHGSEFPKVKIVRTAAEVSSVVIVAEGETDGARLSMLYHGKADVAILPVGAKGIKATMAEQLKAYPRVLVGLDNDEAGEEGWQKIKELVPVAQRFAPPGTKDWCALPADAEAPTFPEPETLPSLIVFGDLAEFELPEVQSYYENGLLPIGGQLVIHGWAKSFKSFLAMDLMASLAQGLDWALFEPTEEPVKVCVVQWEIQVGYYRDRLALLQRRAAVPALFKENFGTFDPMKRPTVSATDLKAQDDMLKEFDRNGIQVALFDPVRRALGGLDPNSEQDVRRLLGFFQRLQDEGITVVFCHHDNKSAAKAGGSDSTSMTGSGAWAGDADSLIHVGLPKGDDQDSSTRRNLHFMLRNSPPVLPRGFEIVGEPAVARLAYSHEAFGRQPKEGDESEPTL